MRINRSCKICGKDFIAIKVTQFFDCRRCFKKDFYLRTKAKIIEKKNSQDNYPIKKCEFCLESSRLNFDPVENPDRFNGWACAKCGVTNRLVWENQNKPNSHQIISNLLITIRTYSQEPSPQEYEPYRLPLTKLEQGNPSVVVMTCETLNIVDIQKNNRRRITFS